MGYRIGRTLQVIGLVALPSAIWAAEVLKSEAACLSVCAVSVVVFFLGYLLCHR